MPFATPLNEEKQALEMRLKKNNIHKLKAKSGWSIPYFSLLVVTIVTIGVTLLFHENAREIDRLRLENMAARFSDSLSDAISRHKIRLQAVSASHSNDNETDENPRSDISGGNGLLSLNQSASPRNPAPGFWRVDRMPADIETGVSINPSTMDESVLRLAGGVNEGPLVSTVEVTKADGSTESALTIVGTPVLERSAGSQVEPVNSLPFSIITTDQLSELLSESSPDGELFVQLQSRNGQTKVPQKAELVIGPGDSETAQPARVDSADSGLKISYIPTKSFRQKSPTNLTILIPFVGALIGLLLFVLLRFDANFTERLKVVAKELDVAKNEKVALLEREKLARREAEVANVAKDEFMATISHEIRTPLNAIGGWAKILENDDIPADIKKKALKTIRRNIKKQSQIINELLLYSSLSGEKTPKNFDLVEAPQLIGEVLDIVRPAAEEKKIEFLNKIDLQDEKIYCDRNKVVTALRNLLGNAIKFTPSGGEIRFYAERKGNFVRLLIRDTGKGIERDFLPHIFDQFKQSDSSTTRQFGGLGLGLAISKRIIKLHGGFIRVRSAGENKGSEFEIKLPVDASSV